MNILDIALKDTRRYFRSAFALGMMFLAPLLITGILYFAFRGKGNDGSQFSLPTTRVQVANLDKPAPGAGLAAGQTLLEVLHDEALAEIVEVAAAPDEASARAAVDRREADVALIIPADFTAQIFAPEGRSNVILYQDPALTVGPGIVKTLLEDFIDGASGAKIAVQVTEDGMMSRDQRHTPAVANQVAMRYVEWVQQSSDEHGVSPGASILAIKDEEEAGPAANPLRSILGPIMAGMMITFVFFTGASSASQILQEEQDGTLSRLFTTPTPQAAVLGGKLLAVLLILTVQAIVLLLASSLLFGIPWGKFPAVAMATFGMVIAAGGFGLLLISFLKNMQQAGPVMGGVMTVTAMLGGLFTTPIPNIPAAFEIVNLAVPQGWALRLWKLVLSGAETSQLVVPLAVSLALGGLFFVAGLFMFRRRFS